VGVAYSNGPIAFRSDLRADTAAHLLADLDGALAGVNWASTPIADGYEYVLTSPQGLQCKVRIKNTGGTVFGGYPYVTVQFVSIDGLHSGTEHWLVCGPAEFIAAGYQVVANCCQLFVSLRGITTDLLPSDLHSVAGGIPYVAEADPDTECAAAAGADAETTTGIWWSSGGYHRAVGNFRTSRYAQQNFSHFRNGVLVTKYSGSNLGPTDGTLQLYPLTEPENVDFWFFSHPQILRYGDDAPFYIHPFIGWGYQIMGQLWDAMLATAPISPVDSYISTTETDDADQIRVARWMVWNYDVGDTKGGVGTWFATLLLLTGEPFTKCQANYAY
jgi:hypothetical protein